MSNITELIKELRSKSGAGFLDCKNALSENNNDIDKLNNFLTSLEKRITPEEYASFNYFNRIFFQLKQNKIDELSGED